MCVCMYYTGCGAQFQSALWHELLRLLGAANGLVEGLQTAESWFECHATHSVGWDPVTCAPGPPSVQV